MSLTPEVLWAQRSSTTEPTKNVVYLTVTAPDVEPKHLKIDLTSTGLTFSGRSESKKADYHLALEFFAELDVEQSKTHHTDRGVDFVLRKKENKEEYWPRLTKDAKKLHFLRTDFDKWVDEDEQNEAPDEPDFGGMGGGMPGMGGMGGDGGFGGIDFSKLGGEGGMPDMGDLGGMGGMGGAGADDDDSDDDMPDLEDAEEGDKADAGSSAAGSAEKPKIEEVK